VRRHLLAWGLAVCAAATWAPADVFGQAADAAAAKTSSVPASAEMHRPPPGYVIGPLDVLEVLFWRDKDLSAEVIVRPDGKITLPLLNEIEAGGLTPEQLRLSVVEQARRVMEDPSAVVNVKQINSRNVFIVGEVAKPGAYPLGGPTSVLQLIATAGGFNEFASKTEIVIIRAGSGGPTRFRFNYKDVVKGDLTQNIELKSGDTVIVP
jgi:polysaccharide export outer membrane protein